MDFPAVTVCNQNRVHCGHLKQLIAEEMVEASQKEMANMYSLLEEAGCKTNFSKYDEKKETTGGSSGCAI